MKFRAGLALFLFVFPISLVFSQNNVGIGTLNPRSTAILDVVSSDQGILLPRVDMTSMTLGLSDHGMIVYDTVMGGFYVWDGTQFLLTTIGDTARWGVNGIDIYNLNSGNVGIGTNIPASQLHVEADVLTNEYVGRFINTNTGSQLGAAIFASSENTAAGWGYGVIAVGNYLGVDANGNPGGFAGLRAQSRGALYGIEVLGHGSSTAGMHIDANGATYGALIENGNVGIGTTTPSEYLHVSGDENGGFVSIVAENTNANGIASFDLVNDSKRMELRLEGSGGAQDFWIWDSNANQTRLIIDDAGLVGVGDWSPQTQFDVTDSLPGNYVTLEIENLDPTGAADLALWNDNTYFSWSLDGSSAGTGVDDKLYLYHGALGEYTIVVDDAGNVGIGDVTNPLVQLHVDGDGLFNGFVGLQDLGVAPGVTNNRMYNVGGNLFWDGNQLLTAADTAIWESDGVDIWNKTVSGGIGINTSTPNASYSATVNNNSRLGGIRIDNIYNGGSAKYGLFSNVTSVGSGDKYGLYANVVGTSASGSALYGTYDFINPNGATGFVYGNYNRIIGSGTGVRYGSYNDVSGAVSNTSAIYGERNVVQHNGSGNGYGNFSIVSGSSNSNMYGDYAQISNTGSGNHYGQYVNMAGSGSATQYGVYVNNSGAGSGTEYGIYTAGEDRNYFSGNVGINNTNPLNRLDVDGGMVVGGVYAGTVTAPISGMLVEGNVGIGSTSANAPLQFNAVQARRKIVLLEGANNDYQFFGFGVGPGAILRYQVNGTFADHVFYASTSSSSDNELMRLTGDGYLGIGAVNPNRKLEVNESLSGGTAAEINNELAGTLPSTGGTKGLRITLTDNAAVQKTGLEVRVQGSGAGLEQAVVGIVDGTNSGSFNRGVMGSAENSSNQNIGVQAFSSGNVGTNYGMVASVGGTHTTVKYGYYSSMSGNGVKFGVYSTGEDRNYFSGVVGVGTQNISGLLHLQQANTGITPQMFIENTSTGDAAIAFELSSQFWSMGVDNSNADKFKIAASSLVSSSTAITIETDGDVGIGTTAPGEKLDVDNGGSIEVDGEYTYESAKTRTIWVAPNAFHSNRPHVYDYATNSYSQSGDGNEDAGYGWFVGGTAGSAAAATTPLNLPNGAIITELEITWFDTYASGNVGIGIMRKSSGSINPTSLGSAFSTGSGTSVTASSTTTTPLSVTINNNSYGYYLKYSGFQGLSSGSCGIKSIKITYTVSQAD